jgi:hypothetical protein
MYAKLLGMVRIREKWARPESPSARCETPITTDWQQNSVADLPIEIVSNEESWHAWTPQIVP